MAWRYFTAISLVFTGRVPLGDAARRASALLVMVLMLLLGAGLPGALAQSTPPPDSVADSATVPLDESAVTMFPHSQTSRWWVSGQDNIIVQWHPAFYSKYSGTNSLHAGAQNATSNVATLYAGLQLTRTTEIFLDVETADGGGLGDALGLAGFTNVDVVRNPQLGPAPYLARGMIRQVIPLSRSLVEEERGPFALATEVPVRRLELRFGKFGLADFFDTNAVGSDSHFQFLNWTVVNNGAYDYAADTRGYTLGLLTEYYDRNWTFRFAEALMPTVANGIDYQWNLRRARAENFEFELRPQLLGKRSTTIRLLSFVNHANMGLYRTAVENFLEGKTPRPEISAHPLQTTVKYGFGTSFEESLGHHWRAFGRWGWNEGQHESYAYTEVDETADLGADVAGNAWRRASDKAGFAFVSNGISADHQHYLALGGRGFLLGDGALNYGRETIEETYYNAHLWRGIYAGVDLQHINNPGYNRDRGPVLVPGARIHLEF
jgi:high affinity Mn2+ porin